MYEDWVGDSQINAAPVNCLELPSCQTWLPVDRVRFRRGFVIRLPNLDRLVRLATYQPQARVIKGRTEDAVFSVERARLGDGVLGLVTVARLPVLFASWLALTSPKAMRASLSTLTQKPIEPLSPPENIVPSLLTDSVLMIALCPSKFCMNAPSGHFHCLMLPVLPVAKVNSDGCDAKARMPFLWWVKTPIVLPAARSPSEQC